MITVNGTLKDVAGAGVAGSVVFQLCNVGSDIPRVAGAAVLGKTGQVEVTAAANGTFTTQLYGNDAITPAGTYYTATVKDENGDVVQINAYQFTGAGPFDLSNAAPYVIP